MTEQPRASGLERFLNLFTVVRPGEARTALLLALNVFLILMAYYILKTVREGADPRRGHRGAQELPVRGPGGGAGVRGALLRPSRRQISPHEADQRRHGLLHRVSADVLLLAQFGVPLGMIYFVWIGIFNLMIVAQFWSFANDVYSKEEGERLLVIVGLGASLGAVAGARVADRLIEPFGVLQLMLLGAGVLGLQLLLTNHIDRVERGRRPPAARVKKANAAPAQNAFAMVFKTRYLLLMALMILLINWINTTGEYILGSIVKEHAVGDGRRGNGRRAERGANHRRFLRQVFLAGERDRPAPPAVRRLTHHQAPRRRLWP